MNSNISILQHEAIGLLKELISIPSLSKQEDQTAGLLCRFLGEKDIIHTRVGNNVFALNKHFDEKKPTILLNSHHDTVKPNPQYSRDPYKPEVEENKLFGLGSNDAGGCLVSLIATYLHFYDQQNLEYNIIIAATAEEEISGTGGIEYTIPYLPPINCAIVGEPTQMQMAVAERGLLVLDCISHGKAGHAARDEGENAIYNAIEDINWFKTFHFDKVSDLLGPVKMSVTSIETENKAHNVIPAICGFVVDTRVNELYSFEEILSVIQANVKSEIKPRSTRLRSTSIALDHPLVKAGIELGKTYYGSPTTSDKALMTFPSLKIGPGDSARSHTADEFIYLNEIKEGIESYIQLLNLVV
ncbi:MAG TPA: M20 family metallo-hydrolase [Chitinophagaceae bacterium]|nr:M20 family metallo-hydrolase [Chitinophagaceae bacterium]MCB9054509.1 M20 family metallo-hydrolase [Chitinophagales bacterium]HPG11400.1 M20 family metallo-hydrolase [Chitinophagaceae bacterium]